MERICTVIGMNADTYIKSLGLALKLRREKLKLTHEQVAETADINVNYYARIERGELNTSIRKLVAIAAGLNTDLSKLMSAAEKLARASG